MAIACLIIITLHKTCSLKRVPCHVVLHGVVLSVIKEELYTNSYSILPSIILKK